MYTSLPIVIFPNGMNSILHPLSTSVFQHYISPFSFHSKPRMRRHTMTKPRPQHRTTYSLTLTSNPTPLSKNSQALCAIFPGFKFLFSGATVPSTDTRPTCTPLSVNARLKLCTIFRCDALISESERSCGTGSQGRWLFVTKRLGLALGFDLARVWRRGMAHWAIM